MRLRKSFIAFSIFFISGCLAALQAIPRYTDKETALMLAKVLDKGTFGRYTISSTYVQNDNMDDYYISVILSNGSSHKWYINQIFKWAREDELQLSNNRNLLFLDPNDSRFVILDKNHFHRLALKANVFIKNFGFGDPLEGQQFRFRIKSFNLIAPTESAFGRDETGSKYRYIIDLYNGMRELLTYEDAYRLSKFKYLRVEKGYNAPTFEKAYHVTKIVAHPKSRPQNGVSQFGVEVQFDQPIILEGNDFPFEVYERKQYNKRTKKTKRDFVIDITIPNSQKQFELRPIKTLEYFTNIKVVNDPKHPKRLLLRANFNPNVMDIPPVIYKNSDTSVYITFFNLIDQTIMSRGMLLESKKRKAAEKKSAKQITVTKTLKKDSDYGRIFLAAAKLEKEAGSLTDAKLKIDKQTDSIKKFEESALYAETDSQLFNSLTKRNQLRDSVINLTLGLVKGQLNKKRLSNIQIRNLMTRLDVAESYSRNQQTISNIEKLRQQLVKKR